MPKGYKNCCGVNANQKCKEDCSKTPPSSLLSPLAVEIGEGIIGCKKGKYSCEGYVGEAVLGTAYTADVKWGFPHMTTVGMWWWKREVPLGWEIVGKSKYKPCQMCYNILSVGAEKDESFLFCPVCFLKPE